MQIQIETGIPTPTKPVPGGKYPFGQMKIGDSFVVELNGKKSWAFIYTAINTAQKKYDAKFTSRLLADGKRRIWRVA